MNEITPRFGLPLDFPRKERDLEASKFQLALNESNARGPDGQRQGPVRPQSQFFYADPNGAGGTGHGSGGTGGSGSTSGTSGTGGRRHWWTARCSGWCSGWCRGRCGRGRVRYARHQRGGDQKSWGRGQDGQAQGLPSTGLATPAALQTLVTASATPGYPKPCRLEQKVIRYRRCLPLRR